MLLPEFAVEPESLNTWPRLQLFTALFGVEKGRLVSRFPGKWLQKACKAVYSGPAREVERVRCVERLRALKEAILVDDLEPWPQRETWLENALERHRTRPFRAIVSAAGGGREAMVVPWEDVEADHPHLRVDTGVTIDLTPEVMAACVAPLLRVAREIVFVDRYFATGAFNTFHTEWEGPLRAFLACIAKGVAPQNLVRLQIHTALRAGDPEKCRSNLQQKLPPAVPPGLRLDVVLCEWSELHNRFVLTDRGGFQFGHGLSSAPGSRDHVNILSEAQWHEQWDKHRGREILCTISGPVEEV